MQSNLNEELNNISKEIQDIISILDEFSQTIYFFNVSYEISKSHMVYYIGRKLPEIC